MGVTLPDTTTYVALKNQLAAVQGITGLAGSRNHLNSIIGNPQPNLKASKRRSISWKSGGTIWT